MGSQDFPVIQLSISRMEHTICAALSEHRLALEAEIQGAVKQYCRPDNIAQEVDRQVRAALEKAIRNEVEKFFKYGAGLTTVADAVQAVLNKERQ